MLDHLWQSTLVAGVAGLLTLTLRKNRASTRYWIWMAASVKFLIPFSLLVAAGSHVSWRRPAPPTIAQTSFAVAMEQVSRPFDGGTPAATLPAIPGKAAPTRQLLIFAWAIGLVAIGLRWWIRWRRVRVAVLKAAPLALTTEAGPIGIEVRSSSGMLEPGVFGVFRPILLLPNGIAERLTPAQLRAILAHEMCHVRRRDNLATAIHMVVEAVFWFHPLVWWLGARLVEERERSCDEEVLQAGSDAQTYAEGILKVCEFYLASPVQCVAGISGANLKKRIEDIMTGQIVQRLNVRKKLLLAAAALSALAGPVVLGTIDAPPARAQAPQTAPQIAQPAATSLVVAPEKRHVPATPIQMAQAQATPAPARTLQPTRSGTPAENGEPAGKPLSFEVASIRVATALTPGGGGLCGAGVSPETLVTGSESKVASGGGKLVGLITEGYQDSVDGFDFPEWVKNGDRFAVNVKIPPNTTTGACHQMIRNLLAERFHLATGFETREVARFYVKVAKSGLKLKRVDESAVDPSARVKRNTVAGMMHYTYNAAPIDQIITMIRTYAILEAQLNGLINDPSFRIASGGGVVDDTGLTGSFAGSFDFYATRPTDDVPEDLNDALIRQLGLTLELRRVPGKVLVIRAGDRTPTEN